MTRAIWSASTLALSLVLAAAVLTVGCNKGAEESDGSGEQATENQEEGAEEAGEEEAGEEQAGEERAQEDTDAAGSVERGRYLTTIGACAECHSPRGPQGAFIEGRELSGVACLFDVAPPADNGQGCLNGPNITNHETGLANWTDEQIVNSLRNGVSNDGSALLPMMPYPYYHHLTDADVNSIVAYLRTVPGVDNAVAASEPPFAAPPQPMPAVDLSIIPSPDPASPDYEAAMRGRYLAVNMDMCTSCHTPTMNPESMIPDFSRVLQGGQVFPLGLMGLPVPPFPPVVMSSNLTNHPTGLAGWTADEIAAAVRQGTQKDGTSICPPMPSGPMGPFGQISDADVQDIAHYVLSLPGQENVVVGGCDVPHGPPPSGP